MTVSATPTVQGSSSGAALPLTTATSTHVTDRDSALAAVQQRLHPRAVTVIAQSISHLPPLSESASVFLAPDAEYRIRQIIQDAIKFMKHSKRTRLIPDDVNSALNLRNADPIFGFGPQSRKYTYSRLSSNMPPSASNAQQPRTRRPTQTDSSSIDVDDQDTAVPHALNPTKSSPPEPPSFSSVHGIPNLFFAVDKERNLADAIRQPLPPVPLEATVMAHWLAVDATQPSIPQNPASMDNDRKKELSGTSHSSALPSKRRRVSAVKGPGGLTNRKRRRRLPSNGAEQHQTQDSIAVEVKPRIKHNLSRELQFYFNYVRQSVFKNDSNLIDNCLDSISTEHGIVQLVPYLSTFVSRTVRKHMNDLPLLFTTMRLMNAMVANRAFKLETYLHQMLPACVSCIVGKRLCAHPKQDHWALRDLSAGLFRRVCDRYEKDYVDIKRRFVITLSEALGNIGRPLTTHYGAIVGFTALGQLTISKSLIPKLPDYAEKVKLVLDAADQSPVRRFEAAKVYCALAWAASVFLADESEEDGDLSSTHSKHWEEQKKSKKANVPSVSAIEPETIEHLIPDASRLLPALQTEFGKKVEPLGDAAFCPDVASRILKDATAT